MMKIVMMIDIDYFIDERQLLMEMYDYDDDNDYYFQLLTGLSTFSTKRRCQASDYHI